MKNTLVLILTALILSLSCFAQDETITYDFPNIFEEDTENTEGFYVENGFHLSLWFGKLSACCTLGMPVTYSLDNLSLDGYGAVSFGLLCGYTDSESVLEIKAVTESGTEHITKIPVTSTQHEMYTVKLPDTDEKIVRFDIFVNSIPEDGSMYDVELEFLKFHKGSSVMLLSTKKPLAIHDGETLIPQSPAVIRDGSTLTPARFVSERFGAEVEWVKEERKVIITKDDSKIELVIDSKTALVNGTEVELASPACIIDNYTYTPARFVAEALGCTVGWDAQTKTVFIDK